MFIYRTRTTQSIMGASVIIIITNITITQMGYHYLLAHPSDVITRSLRSRPLSYCFSRRNHERRVPLSSYAIYLSHSSSPSIPLLTCWYYGIGTGNLPTSHFSGSDSLVTRLATDKAASRRSLPAYEALCICKSDNQNETCRVKNEVKLRTCDPRYAIASRTNAVPLHMPYCTGPRA